MVPYGIQLQNQKLSKKDDSKYWVWDDVYNYWIEDQVIRQNLTVYNYLKIICYYKN